MVGINGTTAVRLPHEPLRRVLRKYNRRDSDARRADAGPRPSAAFRCQNFSRLKVSLPNPSSSPDTDRRPATWLAEPTGGSRRLDRQMPTREDLAAECRLVVASTVSGTAAQILSSLGEEPQGLSTMRNQLALARRLRLSGA